MAAGADKILILAHLSDPGRRQAAARALAESVGAIDLIIFRRDPDVQVLLPAPGFPQTLPGSAAWHSLLEAAAENGRATGAVRPPGATATVESLAVAGHDGSVLVLIGGAPVDQEVNWLQAILPLLAGTFRGEQAAVAAEGQAAVARATAAQAEALALSLDKVRRALGEALGRAKATAEENARLYAEMQEADVRKNEFLATLAHELRNPLAPIRTGLQVLNLAPTPEAATKARQMMARQLGHMVRLIDDLLDLSRITRGKVELRCERLDLKAVVNSAVETSLPLIEAGRHELSVRLPEEPLPIDADLTRLAQVFSNLLTNAAKYTPDGGRIDLSAHREGADVIVKVSDTGLGIPRDMLPHIFDMFTQVGRNMERAQGGLGIGLTLVRRLAEMHRGAVTAESPGPGQGSTFTVRLPLGERAAEAKEVVPSATTTAAPAARRLRVLVVDDNEDGAESLAMLISLHGHETKTAHSGPDALTAFDEFSPALVFLDIGLPGLNGYEVSRRIRQRLTGPQPVLVALTGWGSDEDRQRSSEAGFDHHLTKPVDSEEVEALLTRVAR